jgi:hypothetical protein
MPKDVPMANRIECDYYGAHVTLVDGLISDCARKVAELKDSDSWKKDGWFDVSTTKEPYRVEGKKTMGYEVAEQLGWKLPTESSIPPEAVSACSACGRPSTSWNNWLSSAPERPNMISVQSSGCAPIVKAWDEGRPASEMWPNASTLASGLRVPKPYADYLILDILKEKRRPRPRRHRCRNPRRHPPLGQRRRLRRHLRRPRRRRVPGRLPQTPRQRILQTRRHRERPGFNTGSGLKYLDVSRRKIHLTH